MNKKNVVPVDELNLITALQYYSTDKKDRSEKLSEDFLSMLIEAYLLGVGENSPVNLAKLNQAVFKEYEGQNFEDRVKTHVENDDLPALQRLLVSEWHRDYNQGAYDGIENNPEITMKTWVSMRDERVRDTHEYLEGMTIPVNEEFYTFDGDHAMIPGGFENPENNVNCRCILQYT